jgi:hypothetical protein
MMAVTFLAWTVAFLAALRDRRQFALIVGLGSLLLTAIAFRIHLTEAIQLDL